MTQVASESQNLYKNQRQNYFIDFLDKNCWQVMKSYRKDRIKFFKEMVQGEKILSHSLLDISEFQNVDEIYAKKIVAFNIAKRNVSFIPYVPASEEQAQYDMTSTQKIQIYKKLNIKEKYNQGSIDQLKKIFKIRRSKIPNMLNNLNQTAKKITEVVFDKQIRRSQQKLKFYRSQGKLDEQLLESPKKIIKQSEPRCKFYSLKNGKPQMNERLFPTYEEFVEGRNRAKLQKKYKFDIQKIEKNLNKFFTEVQQNPEEKIERMKGSHALSLLAARNRKASSTGSNIKLSKGLFSQRKVQSSAQNFKKRSRIQENLEKFSQQQIQDSQRLSQKIVRTMTNFYSSKNSKKQEYNNMVEFYQHDRPLTNSIRRKNYDFINPEEKLREITHYRKESQKKRQEILLFNSKTYKEILELLSRYHEDDIQISLEILRSMKHLMKKEYVFEENDVRKILREIKKKSEQFFKPKTSIDQQDQKQDFMIQPVIDIINKAYSFQLIWIDL